MLSISTSTQFIATVLVASINILICSILPRLHVKGTLTEVPPFLGYKKSSSPPHDILSHSDRLQGDEESVRGQYESWGFRKCVGSRKSNSEETCRARLVVRCKV